MLHIAWQCSVLVTNRAKIGSILSGEGTAKDVVLWRGCRTVECWDLDSKELMVVYECYNKDFSGLLERVVNEAFVRYGSIPEAGSINDWAQLAYAMTLHGM